MKRDADGKVALVGARELAVTPAEQASSALRDGMRWRQVAATRVNTDSSRPNLVFSWFLEGQRGENEHVSEKLMLCVLAGSGRPKRSGVVGENIKEAVEVGDVIEALIRGERQVPYRNHKLTRLLQDSLSGIDETLMEGRDRAA